MSSKRNSPGDGGADPPEDRVDDETRDAYDTALGEVTELTVDFVSAALRVAGMHQKLSGAVARLRALVEAMPQEAQRTRDAKAEFVAVLAVIEDRLGTEFDFRSAECGGLPGDVRSAPPGTPGPPGSDDDN